MFECTKNLPNRYMGKGIHPSDTPRINLSNAEDIRREMSKIYRETRNMKIPASDATKLVFILTQILKAYESEVIEKQLTRLENRTWER
ncbi:MAG: hypothetical protein EBS31_06575 [Burkholderiaceae bacterium]|nr:hypothetical protein [Burkholderiaceae bacterium]